MEKLVIALVIGFLLQLAFPLQNLGGEKYDPLKGDPVSDWINRIFGAVFWAIIVSVISIFL
jgi:hypothetical protein